MKRCPTCEKTFDDVMRFCQADGTPLIDAAEPVDPYKTMVARPGEIAAAIPKSSFDSSMNESTAPPKTDQDEVLQLPKEDSKKTTFASEDEIRREMASQPADEQVIEIPPLAEAPKFKEPSMSPPNFGDLGSAPPSPFSTPPDTPAPPPLNLGSGRDDAAFQKTSPPIPSPFNEPKPVEQTPPPFEPPKPIDKAPSPFDAPKPASQEPPPPPSFQEPQPVFQQSAGSPFDQPFTPSPAQDEWNPPLVPDASWQNAPAAQDQSFGPPVTAAKGPNQTTALISLILGVLGIVFCSGLTGPIAIVMGMMARKKASRNPAEYGGAGLALGGIITGLIGTLELILVVLWVAYIFLVVGSAAFTGR